MSSPTNVKKPAGKTLKKRTNGLYCKRKGRRQEYKLRDALRVLNWEAERVYASGAIKGLPGDLKVSKAPHDLLLELKFRKDTFKKIFELYFAHCKKMQDDNLSFTFTGENKLCIDVSSSLDGLLDSNGLYELAEKHPLYKDFKQTFKKIANMQALVKECDVLVITGDRTPYLFIRYR